MFVQFTRLATEQHGWSGCIVATEFGWDCERQTRRLSPAVRPHSVGLQSAAAVTLLSHFLDGGKRLRSQNPHLNYSEVSATFAPVFIEY